MLHKYSTRTDGCRMLFRQFSTCIGYLDHPFKNKPIETEKDRLRSFANTGRLE
jgi:hypothetical protein